MLNKSNTSMITYLSKDSDNKETTIDDVLETVGYRVYQIKFIILSVIIILTQGLAYSLNSLIIPTKNYFNLSSFLVMLSTSFVFLGSFIGNISKYFKTIYHFMSDDNMFYYLTH